jgi:hypothetical protein
VSRQDDRSLLVIVAALGIAMAPALVRIALTIPLRVPLDANEGWNAYHSLEALGGALYAHSSPFFFNVYPPLSFYIVGAAASLTGDPVVAGRGIACLSFAVLAGLLAAAAREMGCTRSEAAFGGVLFAASTLALSHYVGIDDPHFLGQAVVCAGLIAVLREPHTSARLWTAAALMTAGIFIKHSIVALPLTAVAWLLKVEPPAGRRLLGAGFVLGVVSLVAGVAWFGPALLEALVTTRAYSLAVAVRAVGRWIIRVPVVIAAIVLLVGRFPRDRHVIFCVWYVTAASAAGLVFLGGAGVDWNAMFESNWACALTAAVALNRLTPSSLANAGGRRRLILAMAFVATPMVAMALSSRRAWLTPDYWLKPRAEETAAAGRDVELIASRPGPSFCEDLALCYWAGKPPEVDVFNLQQRVRWDEATRAALLRFVDGRYYAVVQLRDVAPLFGPAFLATLNRRYMIIASRPASVVLAPRP